MTAPMNEHSITNTERVTISFTADVDSNEIHPDTVAAMIYNLLLDTPGVANPQRITK